MTSLLRPLLFWLLVFFSTSTVAAEHDQKEASRFLERYFAALKSHDLRGLATMIDDTSPIVIVLADTQPERRFTLSKGDYLQQLKATWKFATAERYQIGNIVWRAGKNLETLQAALPMTENRVILDTATGQQHDLEIELQQSGPVIRITGIKTVTRYW